LRAARQIGRSLHWTPLLPFAPNPLVIRPPRFVPSASRTRSPLSPATVRASRSDSMHDHRSPVPPLAKSAGARGTSGEWTRRTGEARAGLASHLLKCKASKIRSRRRLHPPASSDPPARATCAARIFAIAAYRTRAESAIAPPNQPGPQRLSARSTHCPVLRQHLSVHINRLPRYRPTWVSANSCVVIPTHQTKKLTGGAQFLQ
jgi:hypothetical protein